MAVLSKKQLIEEYNRSQLFLVTDDAERRHSAGILKKLFQDFTATSTYDIFLSHSYNDARVIKQIRDMLVQKGYSVYVDWIEDGQLDRENVSEYAAQILRTRMNGCLSLIYITSDSAKKSVWMPWELGYMDSRTGRVAVAPILDEHEDFNGREYLGLYPYLDLTGSVFYIQRDSQTWVTLRDWVKGKDPKKH